jgi:p-hydroxybenzoate 3-monooxygenase
VLEQGSAAVLDSAGAAERMRTDGVEHDGVQIAFDGRIERIDLQRYARMPVIVYGQTEVTKDLYQLNRLDDISIHYEVQASGVTGLDEGAARIHYQEAGRKLELVCDFVAGCDGYHGVSRQSIPADVLRTYEKTYPFGWLGVLSNTRPASPELIYTNHERGFALCSQRSATVSRNYIQVATDDSVETWSDTAFWDELRRRVPAEVADTLQTGPSIEKSIAPLRSFIAEPLRYGRLFLVGDSGHIVPPTGAKGLNLAVSDTAMLASALKAYYADGDAQGIDRYSTVALKRVWQAQRFSWWFTMATHRLADSVFDQRMQIVDLDYFTGTEAGRTSIAENYVGLPIEDPVTGHSLP